MSTAERVNHQEVSDNYVLQRSIFAYVEASKLITGKVLEIGTGSGYGVNYLPAHCAEFITVDKFKSTIDFSKYSNVSFVQCTVPPLPFNDNTFDFVVSFQVIEHIKNNKAFVQEIYRVLKPGGKFIVTTPNILTTLTRNPWHIREYKKEELQSLLKNFFLDIEMLGVFGNDKVMSYYEENKKAVQKILKWDILNLQYLLPRQVLQIPYDILNRRNRKKLLQQHNATSTLSHQDFYTEKVNDKALDLFYIAQK